MTHKISFLSALIISINIMLGSGIFINTVLLAQTAGGLGVISYIVGAVLIFPLIFVITRLLKQTAGGTFYDFGTLIHPFIGFISTWCYFTAKIASAALGIHIFVSLIQLLFPSLTLFPTLWFDTFIILLFGWLNILNIRIGSLIQRGFLVFKLFPILVVLISALFLFSFAHYQDAQFIWKSIPATIPFVLFAFSGFEAVCSLSQSIEDHQKNGPRAILYAFSIVLIILVLYQFAFFGILGKNLANLTSYKEMFPILLTSFFDPHSFGFYFFTLLSLLGIACSSLGASYGILYSNTWNLFILAQKKHTFSFLTTVNRHAIPFFCIFLQVIGALSYVWLSYGNQVYLQQISASGSAVAYTISTLAFLYTCFINKKSRFIALLGTGSCFLIMNTLWKNGLTFGFYAYTIFLSLAAVGTVLYVTYPLLTNFKRYKSQKAQY